MVEKSKREEIIEAVNRLFIYTDNQEWNKLLTEVFAPQVMFDMSSAGGGEPAKLDAVDICEMWKNGFVGLDAIHHQAGNFLVSFLDENNAQLHCYAIATHFKKMAAKGTLREFVGSYEVILVLTDVGWRINGFRYNLKYASDGTDLK